MDDFLPLCEDEIAHINAPKPPSERGWHPAPGAELTVTKHGPNRHVADWEDGHQTELLPMGGVRFKPGQFEVPDGGLGAIRRITAYRRELQRLASFSFALDRAAAETKRDQAVDVTFENEVRPR